MSKRLLSILKPYFKKKINRNFSGYSSKIDEAKVEASGSLEIIAMTVTSALSQLTGAGKRCSCGNRLRVITYLHPEIGGVLQNRLMIFIDVLNAAETNCANLLSRLQPGYGNH